jgi:prolyl-tRNA synthetase
VRETAIKLHDELTASGLEVLLYDQKARLGSMLADLDLIGIPHRIVIGDRGLAEGQVEYKARAAADSENFVLGDIVAHIKQQCTN